MTPKSSPNSLSSAAVEFCALARRKLHAAPSEAIFDPRTGATWARGDFDLNPELLADLVIMEPPRPAAVLVPVVARDELTVLLTQRTENLSTHAGQIAFPGGRMEDNDADAVATALREAREEIGLDPGFVEPLGFLDCYRSGTGFLITPLVALVRPGFTLFLDPSEVADAFEVPLGFLMDPSHHHQHSREWQGRRRYYYAMPYGKHYIWGATAGMIKNMHERLFVA
jgi:8-oxo-dGTP pyrophosphatase MutT (NUDIX family)